MDLASSHNIMAPEGQFNLCRHPSSGLVMLETKAILVQESSLIIKSLKTSLIVLPSKLISKLDEKVHLRGIKKRALMLQIHFFQSYFFPLLQWSLTSSIKGSKNSEFIRFFLVSLHQLHKSCCVLHSSAFHCIS